MRNDKLRILTWVLMVLIVLSNILNICFFMHYQETMPDKIKSAVTSGLGEVKVPSDEQIIKKVVTSEINNLNINNLITNSVNNKVDSLNLKNGINGKDSVSTQTQIIEKTIEQVPVKGDKGDKGDSGINGVDGVSPQSPIIDCDTINNRWIIKYNEDDGWQLLGGIPKKCTVE